MQQMNVLLYALIVSGMPLLSPAYAASPDATGNAPAAAESAATDDAPDDEQTAEEMLAAEAALEAAQGQSEDAEADAATDAAAAPTLPSNNNEDFVPTIQISEDLSVSFPVDI